MIAIGPSDDLAACHALRRAVFIDEQGVSEADEMDGLDDRALHLLATVDGLPVGTARLLFNGEICKIGRVCVLPHHRGTGVGTALIRHALQVFRQRPGVGVVRLGAQLSALGFYEKLGFAARGPVYDDAGIDHRDMDCPL